MGDNLSGQLGDGSTKSVSRPEEILGVHNRITIQVLIGVGVQLSFAENTARDG